MGAKAFLIRPPYQGVCGRHDTEERRVTSGGLVQCASGTARSEPISERANDAASLVGPLRGT